MIDQDIPHLDESIVQLPEDMRQGLRDRALSDLFFFNKGILGFSDMTLRAHAEFCQFLEQPWQFKLALLPRGFFKSSLGNVGGNLQLALQDPNQRILIANESATNAERFLRSIKQHCEQNRVLRTLFSNIIPRDVRKARWNDQELDFVRQVMVPEPTFDTIGMTGASTSRHFTHICIDDPISLEAVKSKLVMDGTIDRLKTFTKLFVAPEESTMIYIGTRWAYYDTVTWFEQAFKGRLRKFIRAAYDEDGSLIFPERITLSTLAAERDMDEYLFSCNYLNAPRHPDAQELDPKLLKFAIINEDAEGEYVSLMDNQVLERSIRIHDLDITVTVDLAPSETMTSDRNAITVVGVTPWNQAIVLQAWAQRCEPSVVMDELFKINARFHPRTVGIEGVAYQKAFKFFLSDEMERRNSWFRIEELKIDKGGGGKRKPHIRGLQPLIKHRRLYIDPSMHLLRDEMADYPLGQHDDLVDSLAMHLRLFRQQLSPEFFAKLKVEENRLLLLAGHSDLRARLDLDEAVYDKEGNQLCEAEPLDIDDIPSADYEFVEVA